MKQKHYITLGTAVVIAGAITLCTMQFRLGKAFNLLSRSPAYYRGPATLYMMREVPMQREVMFLVRFGSRGIFEKLYDAGTPAGKVYALLGMRVTENPRFSEYSNRFVSEVSEDISMAEGETGTMEDARSVVTLVERDYRDFTGKN